MLGGRSIVGLSLGIIFGATALVGCGSKREEVPSSRATPSAAPAPLPSAALARAEGSALALSTGGFASNARGRRALAAQTMGLAPGARRPRCSGPMRWAEVARTRAQISRLLAEHGLGPRAPPAIHAKPRVPEQLVLGFGKE